ncbi:MAG: AAA family ATPase [Theionarchaea archaeon]|nr:AAA family ATPase [Theionarchaea archaeon]
MNELPLEKLRRACDPHAMKCETTEGMPPLEGIIGQERAVKALKFGLDIKESGFNIYVAGHPGTGRETAVKGFLEEVAKKKPVPADWCYVTNFQNSYEPKAIKLDPGQGKMFQKDVKEFITEGRRELPQVFESEDYAAKRDETVQKIEEERKNLFAQLDKKVQEEGFVLQRTPVGVFLAPVKEGRPLNEQEFMALDPQKREEIQKKREALNADLKSAMRQLRSLEAKITEEVNKLNREVALYAIGHLIADLKEKYEKSDEVVAYLEEVQNDILDNIQQFVTEPQVPPGPFPASWMKEFPFKKYEVNLIVDNADEKGSPVVMERNPTYYNVFGKIEKEAQFGVLTTDFTMIHSGSLHKANGGYLVLPVEELLRDIISWESLKRALRNGCIDIEEAGTRLGYITTKGLKPQPIPLDVKVVLIGNPMLYQMLYTLDKDFKELYKVKVDFDTVMERIEENVQKYAAFICTLCQKEELNHLDASAVAKVVEYSSRLADHQDRLSTRFADVADIIREANFYASEENSEYVTGEHVKKAIEEKLYRSSLFQEKVQEMIEKGLILIDTEGSRVGQVNGLSVMSLGDFSFGRPSRVTASVGMGREGIVDIEREAKLGGNIHTKGVMILSGYLAGKYAQNKPLSLSCRLVFEQSYGGVEGDSASSTELYAILSSLSGFPVNQSIAVTGSVNQRGEVQAIGGVNEKIEGFFEVCKAHGLTGQQGVIIPESNVQNLMLKEEVVEAVKAGKFHVYPVKTIDEGIEILTGVKAGTRQNGTFEEGTVNYRVDKRLKEMAENLKEFSEK